MVSLRLKPGRSAPGQRERDEQKAILNGLKWSIGLAFLAFVLLAYYSQSSMPKRDTEEKIKSQMSLSKWNESNAAAAAAAAAAVVELSNSVPHNAFVQENCDLGMEDWWEEESSWKRRTPAFLIVGAKKCGTTSLHRFLGQHPSIQRARTKELLFFIPKRFPSWEDPENYESKVLVESAREIMYEKDYYVENMQRNDNLLTFEATPDYILYSTFSAKAILCTMPWVKIVVTLRNPVDRLFSHYSFVKDPKTGGKAILNMGGQLITASFEQYVQNDIALLRRRGVIPSTLNATESYMGTSAERRAWREYQKMPNGQARDRPVARSLYAIQLEEWFEALRSIGRDPATSVLIVREEDLKADAQAVSNRVFNFLGLRDASVENVMSGMITNYDSQMSKETRSMLEDFYRPYNQRLYKLLGKEWEGAWDWSEEDFDKPVTTVVTSKTNETQAAAVPDKIEYVPAIWNESTKPFVERFCDLGEETTWWPKADDENAWQLRAPYFLLIGAKKGGTSSIYKYLAQHPLIRPGRSKELHSFQPDFLPQWKDRSELGTKIRVDVARAQIYKEDYKSDIIKAHPKFVSFDATPDYLLYSTFSAQAILCVAPWAKIVVSLRNPIDRLFSHYNFLMDDTLMPAWFTKGRQNMTFEEYVEIGMQKVRSTGVIQNKTTQEDFFGSEQEKKAWRYYQTQRSMADHSVARCLYALQLEEWFDWFRKIGRDPSEILIVKQEDLKSDPNSVLGEIVQWLDLPPKEFSVEQDVMVTHYTRELNPETRKKLQAFFDPYNRRLYKLLGDKWDGVWD